MSGKPVLVTDREKEAHRAGKRSGAIVGFVSGVAVSALVAVLIKVRKVAR